MKWIIMLLLCNFLYAKSNNNPLIDNPLSDRIANYTINAQLNTRDKYITASQILQWKNTSRNQVTELQFHLYMNAFRNQKSTFLSRHYIRHRRFSGNTEKKLGGIDIQNIILNNGYDLSNRIEFIRPDDENVHDSTVIRVTLPEPISPGEELSLTINFTTSLPQLIARTGYENNFYLIGQWFPKIGVYQNGEWNCHQFHANSEFFADFGVYEVSITLPEEYIVGATGKLLNETINDTLRTLHFLANDVHDFAWTAWPDFQKKSQNIEGIQVDLLYAPEHNGMVNRYFEIITHSLRIMGDWLMPYPYPNLTLVDPPIYARRAAGMEYPCFITCGSLWGFPNNIKFAPEVVTAHEFVHQYFYGILASNEFEEPWLDEGFTSYAEEKILSTVFGQHTSSYQLFNLKKGNFDSAKKNYMQNPDGDIIVKPAWEFLTGGYGRYVYNKPVLVLKTLENYLGKDIMNNIMKTYLNCWKFRHPSTQDFINVVNEIAPENMDWYFKQSLFNTDILDYAIKSVSNSRSKVSYDSVSKVTDNEYQSKITIIRNGTFIFPVEVEIVFSNGDTLFEKWSGKEKYKILVYNGPSKVISAQLDPAQNIWLDVNWTNNSFTYRDNQISFLQYWIKTLKIYQTALNSILF